MDIYITNHKASNSLWLSEMKMRFSDYKDSPLTRSNIFHDAVDLNGNRVSSGASSAGVLASLCRFALGSDPAAMSIRAMSPEATAATWSAVSPWLCNRKERGLVIGR